MCQEGLAAGELTCFLPVAGRLGAQHSMCAQWRHYECGSYTASTQVPGDETVGWA